MDTTTGTPPARPRRRRWPWLLAALLVLLPPLALAAALAAAWQALHTEAGTRWWLTRVADHLPGLEFEAPQGALLGPTAEFRLARLAWRRDRAGGDGLRIDELRVSGLQLRNWRLQAPHVDLHARAVTARRLVLTRAPRAEPAPAPQPPRQLLLPLTGVIERIAIDSVEMPGLPAAIEALQARAEIGTVHRIDGLSLRWRGLRLEGSAQLGAAAPLPLQAGLAVRGDTDAGSADLLPPWAKDVALKLQARGPLERFAVEATLAMQDQRLDASAELTPFATLPVSRLDARFAQLDLARLLAPLVTEGGVPGTALTGRATLALQSGRPPSVQLELDNALPGRWDRQRLPVATLALQAGGQGQRWQIERAELALASAPGASAGRVSLSGQLDGRDGTLQLALTEVALAELDRRAPPLRLSGPLTLRHAAAPASAQALGRLDFDALLQGHLLGAMRQKSPAPLRQAVQLGAQGSATADQLRLDRLAVEAGNARLSGTVRARRLAGAQWDTEADLQLSRFDPAVWLPGEPQAAWRRAGNALNGRAQLRARVPAAPADTAALLAGLRGTLALDLADSRLAGQPLAVKLAAAADGAGLLTADASADAADNRLQAALKLRAPTRGAAAGDEQVRLQLDAPALARLSALAAAFGGGPLAGRAEMTLQADGAVGSWLLGNARGTIKTQGTAKLASLRVGALQLESGSADWNATLPGAGAIGQAMSGAAVQAHAQLARLQVPGLLVPQVRLDAEGSLAEHRARLHALLRQPRPAGAEAEAEPAPLALDADLRGRWEGSGDARPQQRWRATLAELTLQPLPARAGAAANGTPLLVARDVRIELLQAAERLRLQAEPGRAEVLGASLRWSLLRWERMGTAPARIDAHADVEPFRVAGLLQRLQPDFGWGGDLTIGARAVLRSDPQFSARVEVARVGGDLHVTEFGNVQPLGLSELRFALEAEAGTWVLTQQFEGSQIGRLGGRQTLRVAADRAWPADDSPIEGALGLHVDNLGTWGAWVPAGWRLAGELEAALRIDGRLKAPELTGAVYGRALGLRNALEGVALRDGDLQARFEGNRAELTRLRFKAGDGELRIAGEARLGAEPQARLTVDADRATVLGRVDRRVVASGQATARLEAQSIAIDGSLRVDEGLIDISQSDAPALGDDVTVVRRTARSGAPEQPPAPQTPRAVDLKLLVQLGERLRLRGRGIDTRLEGELRLTTPNGKLAAHGEIRTERGTYEAYGQKLEIAQGVITFVGDIANPRLNIEAVRANTDTRVGVIVGGSALSPRVRLFSDPELPATEKLALLVTGRSYDSLGGSETLLLQRAALALLAGDGSDGSTGSNFDIARLFQLDELSVRQSDGAVRDTVVSLGKQVSERVYLGYERGLSAAAGNWQLIYRIARRFTLRAQSGEDPAVDLIWLFRWN